MADLTIRPLESRAEFEACVELQEYTWGRGFSERVPIAILQSVQRLGGIVSGAFHGDDLVGFIFGITGWRDEAPLHWSDMLAVRQEHRDSGIGLALKRHQREVMLERGVTRLEWTFDPLQARNAILNFGRLGCTAGAYVRDFYGESDSQLHRGLGTDRLIVEWRLDDERVSRRLSGEERAPAFDDLAALPVSNPIRRDGEVVVCEDARTTLDADRLLIGVPADIQSLKATDPAGAARWRVATRTAFEAYLSNGWTVTDAVRAEDWTAYVLSRHDPRRK